MTVTDTKWMINVDQVLNYDPYVDYILWSWQQPEWDLSTAAQIVHQDDINNADSMGLYIVLQMEISDLWKGAIFSSLHEGIPWANVDLLMILIIVISF